MRFMSHDFTLPSGEKGIYACMFVFASDGHPMLFQNWGPEGMDKERFIRITNEKFAKMLVYFGLAPQFEYDDWNLPAHNKPLKG